MVLVYLVIYLLLILGAIIYYILSSFKEKFNYWNDRGVPQLTPHLIYGDTKRQSFHEVCPPEMFREFYYQFKNNGYKFGGIYRGEEHVFVPVDPDIIKLIVIKDYPSFSAHLGKLGNNLLFNNLFHMDGDLWRDMRKKLTPTFTSGKMKMMYDIMRQKTDILTDLVGSMVKSGETTEIKELLARFTTDVIGSCGFGIECDSMRDKKSIFFQRGQDIFRRLTPKKSSSPTLYQLISSKLGLVKPRSFQLDDVEDFFREVVKDTIEYRESNKVIRKDFMHLMIQLKNTGSINEIVNEYEIFENTAPKDGLSMEELAGQCMLFFTAGFETSSTTISFALLELAHSQDVQEKLRQEVRKVLQKHNGILSYDALQELTYCECVIKETLRKYPPLGNLPRKCTNRYHIPDTDITIEKGTTITIPLLAIQNDPDYFENPEKFIPERFSAENKNKIIDGTYLPFGDGPRQCLGLRFGMMQSKAGIASLINRFRFSLTKNTPFPPKLSPVTPILSVDGGIWLDIKEA